MSNVVKPSEMMARIRFGCVVRERRIAMGLSQEALAEQADLHRTYIGQVERGERNISIDNMERLAGAVGMELWEMLKPRP
jgi:putative transcriptional regulator